MRIARNEKFAGLPMIKVRDLLRSIKECCKSRDKMVELISEKMHLSCEEADDLFCALLDAEYLEAKDDEFCVSQLGRSLCLARCVTPLSRKRADEILTQFINRVHEVENNPQYLYRVKRVLLFGSLINPDAKDYGDIDLAIELESKISDSDLRMKLNQEQIDEAEENGKIFTDFISKIFYPQTIVELFLKNKNRYISLHPIRDIETFHCPYKEIYRWENP